MIDKSLIDEGQVKFEQYLCKCDAEDSMRQFLSIFYRLLSEHTRKVLLHEGVEVCVALPRLKVLPLQQGKGNDHLEQALLVVHPILNAVKSCDSLEQLSSGWLPEIRLAGSSPRKVFIEQPSFTFSYLLQTRNTLRLRRRGFDPTCGKARHR